MKLAATAFALALLPIAAQAQSFNCRTAERPDEILICQSPYLSRLDERMASLYFRLRNSLAGGERRELEADQRGWLDSRIGCGRDFRCIQVAYERRIRQLSNW